MIEYTLGAVTYSAVRGTVSEIEYGIGNGIQHYTLVTIEDEYGIEHSIRGVTAGGPIAAMMQHGLSGTFFVAGGVLFAIETGSQVIEGFAPLLLEAKRIRKALYFPVALALVLVLPLGLVLLAQALLRSPKIGFPTEALAREALKELLAAQLVIDIAYAESAPPEDLTDHPLLAPFLALDAPEDAAAATAGQADAR
jgi:hypothetical protein